MLELALEITPPAERRPLLLLRRAAALRPLTRRVNVIQRAERWTSLEASIALRQYDYEPVWHLANRGRGIARIEAEVALAREAGISRVLCIRGEYKGEDDADTPRIRELVRLLRRQLPCAHVSVTLNHHMRAARVLSNLRAKLDAGARAVQTQVSFDLESLQPFAEAIRRSHPGVSLTPMGMPVLSTRAAIRVSRRLAIPLPPLLLDRLDRLGPRAGWEHFGRFAAAVAADPLYDGLAVMTPIDPDADFCARMREILSSLVQGEPAGSSPLTG